MKKKIYKHNKTGKLYELAQKHLLCKTMEGETGKAEWDRDLDNQVVLYRALYKNADGPYFVRYASDFYANFTRVESKKKQIRKRITKLLVKKAMLDDQEMNERIFYFDGFDPTWDEWVKAGIAIDFGNSEDDFTYDEYLKYRGDYDKE